MTDTLAVQELGRTITFSFEDLMRYHGPGSPGGVATAFKVLRYTVDRTLVRPERGRLLEDFVFEVTIGDRTVTLLLRQGFVTDEFIDLARTEARTADQESRLDELKSELAQHVMAAEAADVYDLDANASC
jgi:hypothetical protein